MLVAVREFTHDESKSPSIGNACVRYYSLFPHDTSITVVDVSDTRARKTVNYDSFHRSHEGIFGAVIQPLLSAILPSSIASQASVVVDGSAHCRQETLLRPGDGLVERTVASALQNEHVASVFLSAVVLEDNNTLSDLIPSSEGSGNGSPSVVEDTKDHFTSVEGASYHNVTCAEELEGCLTILRPLSSVSQHHIYSLILTFKGPHECPNTTIQFVSCAVSERSRGMKSSRHCITTAAALIECRSPVMTFMGTKLSFLLKPALLGNQPGVWISCYSPISPPNDPQRQETFKEAFCVAQTAARIFSSREGILTASPPTGATTVNVSTSSIGSGPLPRSSWYLSEEINEAAEAQPSSSVAAREAESELQGAGVKLPPRDASKLVSDHHLVTTPASTTRPTAVQGTQTRGTRASSKSHDCDIAYELETLKHVMEHAMEKLQKDVREYEKQLTLARDELKKEQRRGTDSTRIDELIRIQIALEEERDLLLREAQNRNIDDAVVQSSAALDKEALQAQLGFLERLSGGDEVAVLQSRIKDLMYLLQLLRQEIQDHVAKQKTYRERILYLEAAVRQRDAELETLRVEAKVGKYPEGAFDGCQFEIERQTLRAEVKRAQHQAAEAEQGQRKATDALCKERERRAAVESQLAALQQQVADQNSHRSGTAPRSDSLEQLTRLHEEIRLQPRQIESRADSTTSQQRSTVGTLRPCSIKCVPSLHRRTQSFEEYMEEAPAYQFERNIPLHTRPRGR